MSALHKVLGALSDHGSKVKPNRGEYLAQCPAHDDNKPSLSVSQGDKGVLLHCFAGCSTDAILSALGLTPADLFDDAPDRKEKTTARQTTGLRTPWGRLLKAIYPYRDNGIDLFFVGRNFDKADGFPQWTPSGAKVADLPDEVRGTPFEIDHIRAVATRVVDSCEGEEDVLAINRKGGVATTMAGGAKISENRARVDAYVAHLIKAGVLEVRVIADRDDPGREHAQRVAQACQRAGLTFTVVELGCEDHCKDPRAAINAHSCGWESELIPLQEPTTTEQQTTEILDESESESVRDRSPSISYEWGASVECVKPDWLWREWLCKGALHVLAGKQSGGKSTWVAYVIARLLQGKLDAPNGLRAGVISLEEPNDRLAARLRASGADMSRVALYLEVKDFDKNGNEIERPWRLPQDLDVLERFITSADLSLVVVDGAGYAINGNQDYANIGTALSGLGKVAERTGCAILAITHTRKEGNTDAVTAAIGSTAWTAIPRICWVCGVDPDDESESRRIVAVGKTNYRRPTSAIAYTIAGDEELEVGYATNVTEVDTTADQVVAPRESVEDRSELAEARRFVLDALSDGPMLSGELTKLAKKEGISERTLRRAKGALKVHSEQRREGGSLIGWEVSLPELGHVGHVGHVGVKTGQKPRSEQGGQGGQGDNELGHVGPLGVTRGNTPKIGVGGQGGQGGQPLSEGKTTTAESNPVPELIPRPKPTVKHCPNCDRELSNPISKQVGLCMKCDPKRRESEPLCPKCERYLATIESKRAGACSHHAKPELEGSQQ